MGIHLNNWPATVGLITGILAKEVVIGALNALYQPGQMLHQFDGAVGAFAYLIFVLLYVPCVSTIAVVARELGKKWACFSVAWSTLMAYGLAVLFYQLATVKQHPLSSVVYVAGVLGCIGLGVLMIGYVAKKVPLAGGKRMFNLGSAKTSACGKCQQCNPVGLD
jgi:ferrous iron transport protein B